MGDIDCQGNKCEANVDVSGRLLLKAGNAINFKLKDRDTGVFVDARLFVKNSTTLIGYFPDVYLPTYDMAHAHFINVDDQSLYDKITNDMFDDDEVRGKFKVGNGQVYKISNTHRKTFPTHVSEVELGNLADKFKCGKFLSSKTKMKQVYSVHTHENNGHVQFVSTDEASLNLTLCLDINGESCITSVVRSDEEITFDIGDFKILVENKARPRKPSGPSLLVYYDINDKGKVDFSGWKIAPYDIRGNTNFGSIGAVQTACLYSNDSFCGFANFRLEDRVDWTLSDWRECAEPQIKRITKQNGIITTLVVSALLIGGAVGGAIGGTYYESTCHHCNVIQYGIAGPGAQMEYAKQFRGVETWYPNIEKDFPRESEVILKENNKHVTDQFVRMRDFEDSHLDIRATGRNIEVIIPEEKGEIVQWRILKCTINLAGGVSTCMYEYDYNGPDSERHIYTKDDRTVILTDELQLHQGKGRGEIGCQTTSKGDKIDNICIGRVKDNRCAKVEQIEIITSPDVVDMKIGIDAEEISGGGGTWDWKGFWDSLTKWWEKLIVIATWVIGVICAIILIVVFWKVVKYLIGLSGMRKSVSAFQYNVGNIGMKVENETKNISIRVIGKSTSSKEQFKERIMPEDIDYVVCRGHSGWLNGPITDSVVDVFGKKHKPYTSDRRAIIAASKMRLQFGKGDFAPVEYIDVNDEFPFIPFIKNTYRCRAPQTDCDNKNNMFPSWTEINGQFCDGVIIGYLNSQIGCDVPLSPNDDVNEKQDITMSEVPITPVCLSFIDTQTEDGVTCVATQKEDTDDCNAEGVYRCGQVEDNDDNIIGYYYEAPVKIKDTIGTSADIFGLRCDRKDGEEVNKELEEEDKDYWRNTVNIDHIDKYNTMLARSYLHGSKVILATSKHKNIETSSVQPIAFYPWYSTRSSSILFALRIINEPKSGIGFEKKDWLEAAEQIFQLQCRLVKEVSIETIGPLTLINYDARGCEFIRPDNKRKVKVQYSQLLKKDTGMVLGNEKLMSAKGKGSILDDCFCAGENSAICMRNDSIANIQVSCSASKAVDGSILYFYDGGYMIGDETASLEYDNGKVICKGDFVYTKDYGTNVKACADGERLENRGLLQHMTDRYEHYRFWTEEGRDCEGIKVILCWEQDYKGVFWVSVGVPLGLILLIIILWIVKCILSSSMKRRLKSGIDYIDKSANSIVNIPASKVKMDTGDPIADFFRRRRR